MNIYFLEKYCVLLGPGNNVSAGQGLPRARFSAGQGLQCYISLGGQKVGSKNPLGRKQRLQKTTEQRYKVNFPRGVMEPLFYAPLSFGPLVLHPPEFWINANPAS